MPSPKAARWLRFVMVTVVVCGVHISCSRQPPPVTPEASPPPPESASDLPAAPEASASVAPVAVSPELTPDDGIVGRSLEEINRESPLIPALFVFDSSELDERGRGVVEANSELLREYPTWVVTIEGHCDERGTAEYNLGLGERRALAVRRYLVELGISEDRLRTVSYGEEFPFEPEHDEAAWAANRRAHFVITAK